MKLERDDVIEVYKAQIDQELVDKHQETGAISQDEIGKWYFMVSARLPEKTLESIWVQPGEDLDPRYMGIVLQNVGRSILEGYKT